MAIFGFLTAFGKEKFSSAGKSLTQLIVAWDPETATEAEIKEMMAELDKITIEAAQAVAVYNKEAREAKQAETNYDKYLAAAARLEEAAKTDAEAAATLEKIIKELETLKPEVDREVREAEEAKEYMEELQELAVMTAEKVKGARTALERAQKDMKQAEVEKKKAAQKAEQSEKLAGLRKDTGSLGIALEAMNKKALEARTEAAASGMKAKLLGGDQTAKDSDVVAALRAVENKGTGESLGDRLAALKR